MNTSQYMDKQIMDLSNSQRSNDFIDLKNPQEDDHIGGGGGGVKEEIYPSYDFQPIRPVGVSQPSNIDSSNLGGARVWTSADSKINSSIRNYGSLDSIEPGKLILEKDHSVYDEALVSEIDRTMKKHADNLLHALEGVSARLSQLETRTRHIENSVDDLKLSVGNNQGSTDGKLRQLEVILREVQTDVEVVKDKQEIMEAQLNLSKLQIPKVDHQHETQNTVHVDSPQQQYAAPPVASAPLQSHHHPHHQQPPPAAPSQPPQHPNYPPPNAPPPPPPSLQNQPPSLHQFPPNQIPQRDPYYAPSSQTPEAPNQQYQAPPLPQPQPPPPQQQQYPAPPPHHPQPQPQYSQPPPPQPQPPLPHQPEETLYLPSQNYRQPHSQPPPSGAPPSQQFYGPPPPMYEPPPPTRSGYGSGEQFAYGGPQSQYSSGSPRKSQQLAPPSVGQSGASGYPQLPTARILPHAIPTAAGVSGGAGGGSGSSGTGNRVPIDDVVDRVTNMGFPRDQVRATVRKLTENGQSVDLNVVLDKLMNDGGEGGNNPQRGWFGR